MSDFDKRLSNMMNEEEHFPNMQQNWERLSPHLQPSQTLKRASLQKRWLVGIAASVSVLAVSAMSYFLMKTNQENESLKNEVTILKNKTQSIENKTITHNDNNTIEEKNNPVNAPKNSVSSSESLGKNEVLGKDSNPNQGNKVGETTAISPNKTSPSTPKIFMPNVEKTPQGANVTNAQNKMAEKIDPSVFSKKNEVSTPSQSVNKENIVENEASNPSKKLEQNTPFMPSDSKESGSGNTVNIERENTVNGETATTKSIKKTDLTVLPLGLIFKPTYSNFTSTPLRIKSALMLSPAIMRPTPRTRRFAVGLQAFTSLGESEGRERRGPSLSGLGLVASYDLSRHFEVTASADLGGMRYDFKEHSKRIKIGEEPAHPPSHPNLKGVSGNQNRQQFSVGLKYKMPTNTILTPFVNVGYDVQRLGRQVSNFNFGNDTTQMEVSVQQEIAPQISKNLWHVGAGLEARIYSFTVDISAQYQKDFSINNDNRVVIRGGIKYRF